MEHLGHESSPWMISAFLTGGTEATQLFGKTTVPYLNGGANFTNLTVNSKGIDFNINFIVTSPDTAPPLTISLPNTFA